MFLRRPLQIGCFCGGRCRSDVVARRYRVAGSKRGSKTAKAAHGNNAGAAGAEDTAKEGTRATDAQWFALMNAISHDKEVLHGQFTGPDGAIRVRRKWKKLALTWNAIPGGLKREGTPLKKAWIKLKSKAKKAYGEQFRYLGQTGGGPPPEAVNIKIGPLYEKVIQLIGTTSAVGTASQNPLQLQLDKQGKMATEENRPPQEKRNEIVVPHAAASVKGENQRGDKNTAHEYDLILPFDNYIQLQERPKAENQKNDCSLWNVIDVKNIKVEQQLEDVLPDSILCDDDDDNFQIVNENLEPNVIVKIKAEEITPENSQKLFKFLHTPPSIGLAPPKRRLTFVEQRVDESSLSNESEREHIAALQENTNTGSMTFITPLSVSSVATPKGLMTFVERGNAISVASKSSELITAEKLNTHIRQELCMALERWSLNLF